MHRPSRSPTEGLGAGRQGLLGGHTASGRSASRAWHGTSHDTAAPSQEARPIGGGRRPAPWELGCRHRGCRGVRRHGPGRRACRQPGPVLGRSSYAHDRRDVRPGHRSHATGHARRDAGPRRGAPTADSESPLVVEIPPPTSTGATTCAQVSVAADGHLPNTPVSARWRITPTSGARPWALKSTRSTATSAGGRPSAATVAALYEATRRSASTPWRSANGPSRNIRAARRDGDGPDRLRLCRPERVLRCLGPHRENVGEANAEIRTLFALITPNEINDPWVDVVVPHELVHLVFDTAVTNPYHFPPRWLNEGLAVYSERGIQGERSGRRRVGPRRRPVPARRARRAVRPATASSSPTPSVSRRGLPSSGPMTRTRSSRPHRVSRDAADRRRGVRGRDRHRHGRNDAWLADLDAVVPVQHDHAGARGPAPPAGPGGTAPRACPVTRPRPPAARDPRWSRGRAR